MKSWRNHRVWRLAVDQFAVGGLIYQQGQGTDSRYRPWMTIVRLALVYQNGRKLLKAVKIPRC